MKRCLKIKKNTVRRRWYQTTVKWCKIKKEKQDGIYKIYSKTNKFIGTGIIENGRLKVDIRI